MLKKEELEKVIIANKIVAKVNKELQEFSKVGMTLLELDSKARDIIIEEGGTPAFFNYQGFPKNVCISVNEALIHGVPNGYKLKDGDLVSIDTGVNYKGYVGDSAISFQVGKKTVEAQKIISAAWETLNSALEILKPGIKTGDLGYAMETKAKNLGYEVIRDFTGHGIGKSLHEDPRIPCYGKPGKGSVIKEGQVICIEPMLMTDTTGYTTDVFDGWTIKSDNLKLTAHVEHALLITADGYKILDK